MKQYLKLLMAREGKEVLGRNGSNLWILTIVLVATFLSIAFSEGSMIYLKDKMEDPFTNWVSIAKSTDEESFSNGLLEYPQYTRPEEFNGMKVPDVLISGHHENIRKYKK